ncbi:hypothetical protein PYW08_009925 [Mythimna loreyi]|uniref:Uncharacterized protein n=1 Tax=Mythimna loreyi TaxID=667449 RepID=A0ACC2Q4U8_9NEOP|nr:hypothetical protein PYW08_009925 [Mythimna loreyi]
MRFMWIVFMSLGLADPRYTANRSNRKWIQSFSVPWVGVLSHKETKFSAEALTGITLIKTKLGLSNAYDVARITKTNIRNTTKAMFLAQEGAVRYAAVTHYVIHPEFNENTLNTIALVYLDYDENIFHWVLMDWPKEDELMNQQLGNIYVFGYLDDHEVLEQVMHSMEFVDRRECDQFYEQRDLDNQWITPTEYQCFRKKFSTEKCVFETGMTLAVHHLRRWKLLGLSVLGPGCALPARFIDFAHYVPWIRQQTSLWALNDGSLQDPRASRIVMRSMYHM